MGYAFSCGQNDTTIDRERMIDHVSTIAAATPLPVSADLEKGFGDDPETVAETIQLAAAAGAVGGSIEDATARPDDPIYTREHAAERVRAAAGAARCAGVPLHLDLARRELLARPARPGRHDRATAGVSGRERRCSLCPRPDKQRRHRRCRSLVDRPVNVVMGLQGIPLSLAELSSIGVKRVSVGSVLCRVGARCISSGCAEMREHGTFSFASEAASPREIGEMF